LLELTHLQEQRENLILKKHVEEKEGLEREIADTLLETMDEIEKKRTEFNATEQRKLDEKLTEIVK